MDHNEAVQEMAAERYLLDELTPDEREAFEEHLFDCPACALDLRAGNAFVDEAKAQLPGLIAALPASTPSRTEKSRVKHNQWTSWWRPVFAAPVFAALLLVIGYQNLVMFPALRTAANQPRLLPWVPLHGATRGGSHLAVIADRKDGVAFPIRLSELSGPAAYSSYSLDLYDPQGKVVWSSVVSAPDESEGPSHPLVLVVPGAALRNGEYAIAVSGVAPNGARTEVNRYVFDIRLTD